MKRYIQMVLLIDSLRKAGLQYKEIDEGFLPEGYESYHILRTAAAKRILGKI